MKSAVVLRVLEAIVAVSTAVVSTIALIMRRRQDRANGTNSRQGNPSCQGTPVNPDSRRNATTNQAPVVDNTEMTWENDHPVQNVQPVNPMNVPVNNYNPYVNQMNTNHYGYGYSNNTYPQQTMPCGYSYGYSSGNNPQMNIPQPNIVPPPWGYAPSYSQQPMRDFMTWSYHTPEIINPESLQNMRNLQNQSINVSHNPFFTKEELDQIKPYNEDDYKVKKLFEIPTPATI